jgi:hypothetical protein
VLVSDTKGAAVDGPEQVVVLKTEVGGKRRLK